MSIKELADEYKKTGRPIKLGKNRVGGGKVYGGKLANSEKGKTFKGLAKKAGK